MIAKLTSIIAVLYKGQAVTDPGKWKNRTTALNAVAALIAGLVTLGTAFGFDLGLSHEDIQNIAVAIVIIVFSAINIVSTMATSDKVGLPDKRVDEKLAVDEAEDWPRG